MTFLGILPALQIFLKFNWANQACNAAENVSGPPSDMTCKIASGLATFDVIGG